MLDKQVNQESETTAIRPLKTEIVVYEGDGGRRMVLVGPPLDDLREMTELRAKNFSIADEAPEFWLHLRKGFAEELERRKGRLEKNAGSLTFMVRMAGLAELAGEAQLELDFLEKASEISKEPLVQNRIATALVLQDRIAEADKLLDDPKLSNDVEALLKRAFIRASREDFENASELVDKAVELDPLDPSARLFRGALNLRSNRVRLAIHDFKVAAEERPTSSAIFGNLGTAYAASGDHEKALAALRRAIALDPLNKNALALYSDLLFKESKAELARGHLKYFLQYEQKDEDMWARMARVHFESQEYGDALKALRRQGSIRLNASVWNNIGVAYAHLKSGANAIRAFRQAITSDDPGESVEIQLLAARNLIAFLVQAKQLPLAVRVSSIAIENDHDHLILKSPRLSDIYSLRLHALYETGKRKEAREEAEKLLSIPPASSELRASIIASLVAEYALDGNTRAGLELAKEGFDLLQRDPPSDASRKLALANNVFFAFSEFGMTDEAARLIPFLDVVFHRNPYPTASLGLFHIRKGNLERGTKLYEEAIGLTTNARDKARIRQKLWLELALNAVSHNDPQAAGRYLTRIEKEKDGEELLAKQAEQLRNRLPIKPNQG